MAPVAARQIVRALHLREATRTKRGTAAALAAGMLKTIDANLLEQIVGGAADTNPAHLPVAGGCPVPNAKNDALARAWNKQNGVTKDSGGNFTKADGPFPSLYRYEYANGSSCAPGAGD